MLHYRTRGHARGHARGHDPLRSSLTRGHTPLPIALRHSTAIDKAMIVLRLRNTHAVLRLCNTHAVLRLCNTAPMQYPCSIAPMHYPCSIAPMQYPCSIAPMQYCAYATFQIRTAATDCCNGFRRLAATDQPQRWRGMPGSRSRLQATPSLCPSEPG